jgi:hypothetical protein
VTQALHSDAAEKILIELTTREQAAVETVRQALEDQPVQGRLLPGTDNRVVKVMPDEPGGHGISVVYQYEHGLDAVLVL